MDSKLDIPLCALTADSLSALKEVLFPEILTGNRESIFSTLNVIFIELKRIQREN